MRLHHIAYVCDDVQKKADSLSALLGAAAVGEVVTDEFQGVKILFLKLPDETRIELLQPLNEKSPICRFLEQGGRLYHFCFEVEDLDAKLKELTESGRAFVVKPPAQAPAIENRRVAFVVTDEKDLIEFVETPGN